MIRSGHMKQLAQKVTIISAMALSLGSTACLVTSNSEVHRSGNYVPETTFSMIHPGETTSAWVRATLGQPSKVTQIEAGTIEIWEYMYTERRESGGAVFLIFGGSDVKEVTGHVYVQIKNGIVTNCWRG